jgi:c-di-GMP-binding flagellar brake protein YcgR
MIFGVLVIVIAVLGLFMVISSRNSSKKGDEKKQRSWIQFYAKGKDSGFSFKEIELLRRLAIKADLDDPASLFWSQNQLDLCIRSLVRSAKLAGTDREEGMQEFLSKLYDYRKKIEMEKPKVTKGISGSRQISESQALRILLSGTGVFKSHIIKNTGQYITIARPSSPNLPASFTWTGQQISVYFWRSDDAGYVFDSMVINEVYSKGYPALQINHAESLFRTQKRKSVRIKTHKSAFLYLINEADDMEKVEEIPGLKCIIDDISDSGCAVTVGGKAIPGLRVKIQFVLEDKPLVMCGTVRSVDFKDDVNRSTIHIQADEIPLETRNQILGEVFGMLSGEEESLPFRVLEEELEGEADPSAVNTDVI